MYARRSSSVNTRGQTWLDEVASKADLKHCQLMIHKRACVCRLELGLAADWSIDRGASERLLRARKWETGDVRTPIFIGAAVLVKIFFEWNYEEQDLSGCSSQMKCRGRGLTFQNASDASAGRGREGSARRSGVGDGKAKHLYRSCSTRFSVRSSDASQLAGHTSERDDERGRTLPPGCSSAKASMS